MTQPKAHVLFLCTGNSCRSQMAEGYANFLGAGKIEAQSAGIEAHGKNARAVAIMAEDDIDISDQESTMVSEEMLNWADVVVTVCGHADEHCPTVAKTLVRKHWPLNDPAKAQGNEDEITSEFRRIREDVKQRVIELIENLQYT